MNDPWRFQLRWNGGLLRWEFYDTQEGWAFYVTDALFEDKDYFYQAIEKFLSVVREKTREDRT